MRLHLNNVLTKGLYVCFLPIQTHDQTGMLHLSLAIFALMLRTLFSATILLFLLACTDEEGYRVVKISDGDTVTLLSGTTQTRVRLYGIDAPERGQDYGTRATEHLRGLLAAGRVRLVSTGGDRYQRTIGILYTPDGENVNLAMLEAGYAWHYKKYSNDLAYAHAELRARENLRGLWQQPRPTPPWEYRAQKRKARSF